MTAVLIVVLVLVALLLGVLLGLWLARRRRPTAPPPPPHPPSKTQIPSRLDPATLKTVLVPRLAGAPADGSAAAGPPPDRIVWVDGGDEVVVHLDSLQTRIVGETLVASLELESLETGRSPLVVVLALGAPDDPAGLVATTDELPRGHSGLAARWGPAVQRAIWASLLSLAKDHAGERDGAPRGFSIDGDALRLHAGEPLVLGSGR